MVIIEALYYPTAGVLAEYKLSFPSFFMPEVIHQAMMNPVSANAAHNIGVCYGNHGATITSISLPITLRLLIMVEVGGISSKETSYAKAYFCYVHIKIWQGHMAK